MSTKTINFKSKEKSIKIGDKIYVIAKRTGRTESMLKSWKETLTRNETTCIENFEALFKIFLGNEAQEEIMADGEDCDIDFLDAILVAIYELYNEDKIKAEQAEIDKQLKQLAPMKEAIKTMTPALDKLGKAGM